MKWMAFQRIMRWVQGGPLEEACHHGRCGDRMGKGILWQW